MTSATIATGATAPGVDSPTNHSIDERSREEFVTDGFTVARGMFSPEEVARFRDHFMDLNAAGRRDGDYAGVDVTEHDPLKKYPRMIHMHRWDQVTRQYLLDPRIAHALTTLLGAEPYAVQSMIYFKPPGARGQAIHQDNFFLRAQPSTCCAAWLALDKCDADNGALKLLAGSQDWPLLCTVKANTTESFTDVTVPIPDGVEPQLVEMEPGDVLFFNGQLVHGSTPNITTDRFRRALIGHYIQGDAEKVGEFYSPVLRMDGAELVMQASEGGGTCGVWVDQDGVPVIEESATEKHFFEHE